MRRTFDQLGQPTGDYWSVFYERRPKLQRPENDPDYVKRKAVVMEAAACVVGIISPDVSPEMTEYIDGCKMRTLAENQVFLGSGTTIECEEIGDGTFTCTIITAANLFTRTHGVEPADIKVEVYLAGGEFHEGVVSACDFHYNLAVVKIVSKDALPTANFRDLDDIMPIVPEEQHQSVGDSGRFQLHPHSAYHPTRIRICPGDKVTALCRNHLGRLCARTSSFRANYPEVDCKEVYSINVKNRDDAGGPAINSLGQIIGIMVFDKYFLPTNIVSRWWKYYKQNGEFYRPWLGVDVANFHTASSDFVQPFLQKFKSFSSGVIVKKVVENSPAHSSGLRSQDVIVQCGGQRVRSIMEFFEEIWEGAGASSVELCVLRLSGRSDQHFNLKIDINNKVSYDNFYRWPVPEWWPRPEPLSDPEFETESESESDPETSESWIMVPKTLGRL